MITMDSLFESFSKYHAICKRMDEILRDFQGDWVLYDLLSEMRVAVISALWNEIKGLMDKGEQNNG